MIEEKSFLKKGQVIGHGYEVILFIKKGLNAETYRVRGENRKLYFLKLFKHSNLPISSFDKNNNLLESEILKNLKHQNIVTYVDSGELIIEKSKFAFLIQEFIAGETLEERFIRGDIDNLYDIKSILTGILKGLKYLHELEDPVIHNGINIQNIMMDLSSDIPQPIIIDFGHARSFYQPSSSFYSQGLNPYYLAPECFHSIFSPQTDLFSVGALAYQLIMGNPPWYYQSLKKVIETNPEELLEIRKRTLSFFEVENKFSDFDRKLPDIIRKALDFDSDIRFKSSEEFIDAINGEIEIEDFTKKEMQISSGEKNRIKPTVKKLKGRGFDAIAGMKELKEQLQIDIIDAITNPEEYIKFGITMPNGMLLYGPPGCGKTYFSKCLAEEVGFNFIDIKPSSLQSKYVNATQENIANMFKQAEENSPTIIFIDELDSLIPSRDLDLHQMNSDAVNEFLAQMNGLGERGIFIVGATNRPDRLDQAVLRAGRLDKKIYVPPPDFEARKSLFEMYISGRPVGFGIDYEELARLTEKYVTSDIEFIVNESAKSAMKNKSRINMEILENVINKIKPSVSLTELNKYEKMRMKMESEDQEINSKNKNPFGF